MGLGQSSSSSVYDQRILKEANETPVLVYSTTTCPYCVKAKRLLQSQNISFGVIELNEKSPLERQQYALALQQMTGERTVPQMFVCGEWIGGFAQLQSLVTANLLHSKIAQCSESQQEGRRQRIAV